MTEKTHTCISRRRQATPCNQIPSTPSSRSPGLPDYHQVHDICCRGKEVVNKKVQYTQEQARLKREQMAAAAEARMAALKVASQQQTLWSDPSEPCFALDMATFP